MTNLKKHVHQYDASSALHRQIGRALLDVLATTTEPGRIWLGNLSTEQIQQLIQRINPDAIKHLSQKELNGIFLPLGRILADGSANINHQKLIAEHNKELSSHLSHQQHVRSNKVPLLNPTKPPPNNPRRTRNPAGRTLHRQQHIQNERPTARLLPTLLIPPPH